MLFGLRRASRVERLGKGKKGKQNNQFDYQTGSIEKKKRRTAMDDPIEKALAEIASKLESLLFIGIGIFVTLVFQTCTGR